MTPRGCGYILGEGRTFTMQTLPPGTVIGNYKILKALGRGGFGVAYVAWDKQLERNVVLKECFPTAICMRMEDGTIRPLRPDLAVCYQHAMADMQREARTLAQLNHERVVRVYEVFESQGGLYYVMPWLSGGSLREKMDEAADAGQTISPSLVTQWLLGVLEGLQYLHEKGLVHRDIKPANIMFDEAERPVIIDFGACVMHAASTVTQGEFSVAYAAPEQLAAKGTPFAGTDLFALASTAYEMLSGSMPEEPVRRLLKDELIPLNELPGMEQLPLPLVQFVMQNLQLAPESRNRSAAYWREVLSGILPCKPMRARGARRRVLCWWGGVGVVLLGGAGIFAWLGGEEESAPSSFSQGPVPALTVDALFADYVAHNKAFIDTWAETYARYVASLEAIVAEYEQACTECRQQVASGQADAEKFFDIYSIYYKRFLDERSRFYRDFHDGINSVLSEPEKHYPAFSEAQLPLLPELCKCLEAHYGHYCHLPPHLVVLKGVYE